MVRPISIPAWASNPPRTTRRRQVAWRDFSFSATSCGCCRSLLCPFIIDMTMLVVRCKTLILSLPCFRCEEVKGNESPLVLRWGARWRIEDRRRCQCMYIICYEFTKHRWTENTSIIFRNNNLWNWSPPGGWMMVKYQGAGSCRLSLLRYTALTFCSDAG